MREICQENGDASGVSFWGYALDLVETLGVEGMSDEEEGVLETELDDGRIHAENVNRVLRMGWRHPSIGQFLEKVDATKELEKGIFRRGNRPKIPRVRVEDESQRPPPCGLPEGVFRTQYLEKLPDYAVVALRLLDRDFQVRLAK